MPATASKAQGSDGVGRALVTTAFFLSGAAAILYQILWQRALFTIFGTSSESVTLVVTAFMLGLGLGSLVGGALSHYGRPIVLFGLIEAGIGLFGMVSLPLFRWVGVHTASAAGLEVGLLSFAVLLVPTLLMGATLPLLSADLVRATTNVGASVGDLYAVNTLGSAAAAMAAPHLLFPNVGQSAAVYLAGGINLVVATTILGRELTRKRTP